MRRATTLVYLLSSAKLAGLWQYRQPSCGAIQVDIEAIRRVNCASLRSPNTLTFLYSWEALGPVAAMGGIPGGTSLACVTNSRVRGL